MASKHAKSKDGIDRNKKANGTPSGYGKSGGKMGAGQSGSENLGSEKPTDDAAQGSEKPSVSRKKK